MHLTERYTRRDFGHMDVEMTFDDPAYYTRPFTVKLPMQLVPDSSDVFEEVCNGKSKRTARTWSSNGNREALNLRQAKHEKVLYKCAVTQAQYRFLIGYI